ncbi:MAG: cysteine hydrolase [Planctomycetaceae bacterium]|nr:cysteine hydrolase [Planctomycetaceae bacterium]
MTTNNLFTKLGKPLCFLSTAVTFVLLALQSVTVAQDWTVHLQKRSTEGTSEKFTEKWNPKETVIIVCDMWGKPSWETCDHGNARVEALAVGMNPVFAEARKKGILIIFAPSTGSEEFDKWYGDLPGRKVSAKYRHGYGNPRHWDYWVHGGGGEREHSKLAFPGEKNAKGWNLPGVPGCPGRSTGPTEPQPPQTKTLVIDDQDILTDDFIEMIGGKVDGKEYTDCLFKERGIKNVILTGVHTDICVIGRPWGCRAMKMAGYNVVLCRDLTDSTWNCHSSPTVPLTHEEGTAKICDYVETYICPTITSTEITGKPAFQFDPAKIAEQFPIPGEAELEAIKKEAGKVKVAVVSAFYGSNQQTGIDVTEKVKAAFTGTRYIPMHNYNDTFGDPQTGVRKSLWITYTIDGQTKTQSFGENERIILKK